MMVVNLRENARVNPAGDVKASFRAAKRETGIPKIMIMRAVREGEYAPLVERCASHLKIQLDSNQKSSAKVSAWHQTWDARDEVNKCNENISQKAKGMIGWQLGVPFVAAMITRCASSSRALYYGVAALTYVITSYIVNKAYGYIAEAKKRNLPLSEIAYAVRDAVCRFQK